MNIGLKFLFISKFFIVLFIIINFVYLFPINIFDVSYYFNLSTVILDTATLLILGFSIPKFAYLNYLQSLTKTKHLSSDLKEKEIKSVKHKIFYNSKMSFFISVFFVIIAILQPINLIFTLNKNDVYSTSMIELFNNQLKTESQKIDKEFYPIKGNLSNNKEIFIEEKKKSLSNIAKKNIDIFLKKNNKDIFNKIKFIIRNLIMAIIWALIFYKLSVI